MNRDNSAVSSQPAGKILKTGKQLARGTSLADLSVVMG
jgi:hypothetical protein